jgi:uncharacterized membrane protein HdeD (DUF308 family)
VGIALIIWGLLAASLIGARNVNSVGLVGLLTVVAGLTEAVHAFYLRKSAAFLFHLVPALAGVPVGLLMVTHQGAGAVPWMLVFASSFTMIGLFRLIAAFRFEFPGWEWTAADGFVTVLLGAMFWTLWLWLVPWFFGLAVGVSLILRGWSSIMFGHGLRSLQMATARRADRYGNGREAFHEPVSTKP